MIFLILKSELKLDVKIWVMIVVVQEINLMESNFI